MPILQFLSISVSLYALPHITCCMNLYLALHFNFAGSCASRTCKMFSNNNKTTQPRSASSPLQKNPKTVVWIQLWTKLCDYPFLNKACTFYDLFYWCRSSQIFCLHRCTYKTLEDRQVLILILPGPVMVRVATDLLLKSCAV